MNVINLDQPTIEQKDHIEEFTVNTLAEAMELIPENCKVLIDVDGTMLGLMDSLMLSAPFRIIRSTIENRIEKLTLAVRDIHTQLLIKSGNDPIVVSNRVVGTVEYANVAHRFLDRVFGSSNLAYILKNAGFDYEDQHTGLDRQRGHRALNIAVKGTWDRYLKNLNEHINLLEAVNGRRKLILITDNMNIIGPIANEHIFMTETLRMLDERYDLNLSTIEVQIINIQKNPIKSLLYRLGNFTGGAHNTAASEIES